MICVLSTANVALFSRFILAVFSFLDADKAYHSGKVMDVAALGPTQDTDMAEFRASQDMDAAVLLALGLRTVQYEREWNMVVVVPFQAFMQMSCFITLVLSGTRMLALLHPLWKIQRVTVLFLLSIAAALIAGNALYKYLLYAEIFRNPKQSDSENFDNAESVVEMSESAIVGVMIIVVGVFSSVSIARLRFRDRTLLGRNRITQNNRRAAIMILILSCLFILFNSTWIILQQLLLHVGIDQSAQFPLHGRVIGIMITFILMPLNSAVNPLVYMGRNAALNGYMRTSLRRRASDERAPSRRISLARGPTKISLI